MVKASIAPHNYKEVLIQLKEFLSQLNEEKIYEIDSQIDGARVEILELNKQETPVMFYQTDLMLGKRYTSKHFASFFRVVIERQEVLRIPCILITFASPESLQFQKIKERCLNLGIGFGTFDPPSGLKIIHHPNLTLKFEEFLSISDIKSDFNTNLENLVEITRRAQVEVDTDVKEKLNENLKGIESEIQRLTEKQKTLEEYTQNLEEQIKPIVQSEILKLDQPEVVDWRFYFNELTITRETTQNLQQEIAELRATTKSHSKMIAKLDENIIEHKIFRIMSNRTLIIIFWLISTIFSIIVGFILAGLSGWYFQT